jgi:hypothetical protein
MADKKYVRLNPKKMGFKFLGVVKPKRQSLLYDALKTAKKDMGASWKSRLAAKEIFWLNIWQDEAEEDSDIMGISDPKIAKALDKWCRKAARKYCGRNAIIDGYGFAVNPRGSQYQPWHIDYATDCANLFIPMTPFTNKNATQYITLPSNTPEDVLEQVASDTDKVDVDALERGIDYLVIQQVVAGRCLSSIWDEARSIEVSLTREMTTGWCFTFPSTSSKTTRKTIPTTPRVYSIPSPL